MTPMVLSVLDVMRAQHAEGPVTVLAIGTVTPGGTMIRPICITILYHNLLLFIDIFHI
jgi:hypothetical protein